MSSTNRGGQRIADDNYETPSWCVEWLLREWRGPGPYANRLPRFLEPCAGRGAIIQACNAAGLRAEWVANEKDPARCEALLASGLVPPERVCRDEFLTWKLGPGLAGPDCILTNPPYSLAEQFLQRSLEIAPVVCFLLRLNFLGSQKRAGLLRQNPPDVYVLSKRPSFTGHGTDSVEYAWFVWDPRVKRRSGSIMVLAEPDGPLAGG